MTDPAPPLSPLASRLEGVAPLSHLGVIRVTGADANSFLHSQLTHDFSSLGSNEARLAAYLTPQGRTQASFIGWQQSTEEILLVCASDLLETTRKRLSMFVLRAKAKLVDATADYVLYGLAGEAARAVLPTNCVPWSRVELGAATAICLYPACGVPRAMWLSAADSPPPSASDLDEALWQWGEVRSGVATVTAAIAGALVPQMLNYESVDGVNFKKGCYPGQEVVARSQFRGTLKRRTYVAHIAGTAAAGDEVFVTLDAEQPAGLVVQAAPTPDGSGTDALVSLQTAASTQALYVGGQPLALLPLPYALLKDL